MNNRFTRRLEEYLSSECGDYDLTYKWEWNDDTECCKVAIQLTDDE